MLPLTPPLLRRLALCTGLLAGLLTCFTASATMVGTGLTVLPETATRGPVTVFYPSSSPSEAVKRGPFTLNLALQGAVLPGNGRLIVASHGSGGNPWPMTDLATSLVQAGYVVAMPEHEGDNYRSMHLVGPESWKRRPAEVSAAIDAVQADARFAPLIDFTRVGVYGTSAGGITALIMGGARWSPQRFQQHCLAHMEDDFNACVGLVTSLKGNWADGLKTTVARWFHRLRFNDATDHHHDDPRVKAVIASVPMAAPIDMTSLAQPKATIGLMIAQQDTWLHPRFHVNAVRAACTSCAVLWDDAKAGHGSLFSPWPLDLAQSISPLLVDPPGFDHGSLPAVYARMGEFFTQHLKSP